MPCRRVSRVIGVVIAALVLQPAVAAEGPALDDMERAAGRLSNQLAKDQAAGQAWLNEHADAAFTELARLIEHGDGAQRQRAARVAAVFISPWVRGMARGDVHKGQIELFQPQRPTARPVDHAHAGAIRTAALAALRDVLKPKPPAQDDNPDNPDNPDAKNPGLPVWDDLNAVRELCACLAEVADADAADQLAALLEREPNRFRATYLLAALDTYHGLPQSYAWHGICGNSSPEEFRQFDIAETARCNEARAALLKWHGQHAHKPPAQRIEAALDVWDKRFGESEHYGHYTVSGDWTTQTIYTSLIRLGEPAADAMRKRAAAVDPDKTWRRAGYEVALAAITGKIDKPFVAKMLKGETFERMLACEIIAAAGSKDFRDELAAMVQSNGPYKKASHTLAVVYRTEAIPILEKAWPDDFVAECAINELRAWGE